MLLQEGRIRELRAQLESLRTRALALEDEFESELARLPDATRPSARNLLHYVALRQHDLRELQAHLAELGLSSLGRLEAHVVATLETVLAVLGRIDGERVDDVMRAPVDFREGPRLLAGNAARLLGEPPPRGHARIMVTLPTEAGSDPALVHDLVDAGMSVARINCAHDDAGTWLAMVENVRAAARANGRDCRVHCDLSGPKLRTGPMPRGAGVVRWRPVRDELGRTLRPARLWISWSGERSPGPVDAVVPARVENDAPIRVGDQLVVVDLQGRRRQLDVVAGSAGGVCVECTRGGRLADGTVISNSADGAGPSRLVVDGVAAVEIPLRLSVGDRLLLDAAVAEGRREERDGNGRVIEPGRIGCTLPEAFRHVKDGDRILFDDGKLSGVIRSAESDLVEVEIVAARGGSVALHGDRGINLPDTAFEIPALTAKDLVDLDFVVRHADSVGLSFVRRVEDVVDLHRELDRRTLRQIGVILKVESRLGFEALPRLLLAAMARPPLGVMVARGDLGVEVGFERLAELQEEILWLGEAAHVPVVWATQVLEGMTKRGMPSRAEVTDAAMSSRAECVMLNKGARIVDAVRFLANVLGRMQDHQDKKTAQLRGLSVARSFEPLLAGR